MPSKRTHTCQVKEHIHAKFKHGVVKLENKAAQIDNRVALTSKNT